MPEIVIYDHAGFAGAYARTNLAFHYLGNFWNDRISCVIVVSGVWRFYRDEYYKGDYWDLGPGFYERRHQLVPADRAHGRGVGGSVRDVSPAMEKGCVLLARRWSLSCHPGRKRGTRTG